MANAELRVDVLGVGISAVNMTTAVQTIASWIDARQRRYVCVTGVHGVMESQRDPELLRIHNESGMTTPDGMPMVWAGRWAGARHMTRVYGPDLMLALCERGAAMGWRQFFFGATDDVTAELERHLRARFLALIVAGSYSPPFRPLTPDEDTAAVELVNRARPDIVWVGLGTPKQERWMASHVDRLNAPVLIGVGAAFDIHAQTVRQAPVWMQRHGLEWLFRLRTDPRRLWRRYLRNNPKFVLSVLIRRPRLVVSSADVRFGPGPDVGHSEPAT